MIHHSGHHLKQHLLFCSAHTFVSQTGGRAVGPVAGQKERGTNRRPLTVNQEAGGVCSNSKKVTVILPHNLIAFFSVTFFSWDGLEAKSGH